MQVLKKEKPYFLVGFVVLEDKLVVKKDVEEIDLYREMIEKRINEQDTLSYFLYYLH